MRIAEIDGYLIGCEIDFNDRSIYVEKMMDREEVNTFHIEDCFMTLNPTEAAALGAELIKAAAELGHKDPAIEFVEGD